VPDVLAKGGDWPVEKIVGREVVEGAGGQVVSIDSSVPEYSSSEIIERIFAWAGWPRKDEFAHSGQDGDTKLVIERLRESALVKQRVAQALRAAIVQAAHVIVAALRRGNKVLLCGNGGSAADAQHIAAEIVGRFKAERDGLPAIALTTDTSILTAVGNDYGFENVFARQMRALAREGDVLVAISTSGNSENVIRAVEMARESGVTSIGLLGRDGGRLAALVDIALVVPSQDTARIQEAHITIGHIICELLDEALASQDLEG
jgi:D-sedoheptulose 7-phosphate isomerase